MFHPLTLLTIALSCLSATLARPLGTSDSVIPTGLDNFGRFANGTSWVGVPSAPPQAECRSNADCLKKRLPLLRPRASRTRSALQARASASVPVAYSGYLAVYDLSNVLLGFVASPRTSSLYFYGTLTQVTTDALLVHFTAASSGTTEQINVSIDPSTRTSTYEYLSLITGVADVVEALGFASVDNDMKTNSKDNCFLTGSKTARAQGAKPAAGDSSFSTAKASETAVFVYDADTGTFSSEWIDTSGKTVYTYFVYSTTLGAINTSADVAAFKSLVDSSYQEVRILFVPQ